MRRADGVIGVTTKERVHAVHERGQRGFYEFKDAGYANCNLYGLSNNKGLARAGKRFGARLEPVVFEDGALAIDVDNERTYAICEWVLGQRLGMDIPKPEIEAWN